MEIILFFVFCYFFYKFCDKKKEIVAPKQEYVSTKKKKYTPTVFDEYIGQEKAKDLLNSYIKGTAGTDRQMDHILISGQSGCGKTTLARCFVREYFEKTNTDVSVYECIAKNLTDIEQVVSIIKKLNGGFFITDEIQGINRDFAEQFYTIMTDFTYNGEQLPPFTFIACTTEYGEMMEKYEPFVQRFGLQVFLESYIEKDIIQILNGIVNKELQDLEGDKDYIFNQTAKNCRITPRIAISYLRSSYFMQGNIDKALWAKGIVFNGYTKEDYKILRFLESSKKAGVNAICAYLGTSKSNYNIKEGFLLRNDLVVREPSGRRLTEKGKEILHILEEKIKEKQ